MDRVSVVGCSGAGKTTLARQLAQALDCPFVELDAVFHLPDWAELPEDQFRKAADEAAGHPRWVIDGNYSVVREIVWSRADTVIWLDLSFLRVMSRVVARTLYRVILRTELWNGNREPLTNLVSFDPQKSIIAWTAKYYRHYRQRYMAAARDPRWGHLTWIRLESPAQVSALLANIARSNMPERSGE